MSLLVKMLKGAAVYWPPVGVDQFGKTVFGSPVAVAVRWEDSNEEVLDDKGEKTIVKARVFVGQDVQVRGVLINCPSPLTTATALSSIQDLINPFNNVDSQGTPRAHRIVKYDKLPNLKYRQFLRTTYLT